LKIVFKRQTHNSSEHHIATRMKIKPITPDMLTDLFNTYTTARQRPQQLSSLPISECNR